MSPSTTAFWRTSPLTRSCSRRSPNRFSSSASSSTSAGPTGVNVGIRLGLVELGLGQLDVAGGHVVGDDEAGDVVGQIVFGELGADRHVASDDETDLDLVVQESDVGGLDDVVDGPLIDPDALRKNVNGIDRRVHARRP